MAKKVAKDTKEENAKAVELNGGAELRRFKNECGVEMSAIYLNGEEIYWHEREHEAEMVKYWNDNN